MKLSDVRLAPRSKGALKQAGFTTVEEVLAHPREKLLEMSGVTEKTLADLEAALAQATAPDVDAQDEAPEEVPVIVLDEEAQAMLDEEVQAIERVVNPTPEALEGPTLLEKIRAEAGIDIPALPPSMAHGDHLDWDPHRQNMVEILIAAIHEAGERPSPGLGQRVAMAYKSMLETWREP